MSGASKVFLELLRVSIWGGVARVPDGFKDWGTVFTLAKKQAVLCLVAHAVLSDPVIGGDLEEDVKTQLKSHVVANMGAHRMLNSSVVQVVSALDAAGVPSVLLKGQALARNYPIPELRACGDIDIYAGPENYLKACEVLGYLATWKESRRPEDNLKHYDIRIGKTPVEIHRYSDVNVSKYYNKIYQAYSHEGLSHELRPMDFLGTDVYTPADDFNAFYIFNHLWHHFLTSGIGLRQFCDWMMFLHVRKDEIDRAKLKKIIDDMDLMTPWQTFGCVLVDELGLPEDEFPFYDSRKRNKVSKVIARVLEEGNFGKEREMYKDRSKEGYFQGKVKSLYLHFSRSIQLFIMFPSHTLRQFGYTFRRGMLAVWKDKLN
jgi:hypothetical protein